MSMFAGFPPYAWAFLTELQADNTKAFFDANRRAIRRRHRWAVQGARRSPRRRAPYRLGLDVRAEPNVGRSLFRINRDTRFAADKTPYKTHLDFLFWVGDGPPRPQPGFIMRITADRVLVGGGRMAVTGGALDAYRAALDDPERSDGVRTPVDTLLAAGAELSHPDRARPPRPFPVEHPNADLLRRDGFHLSRTTAHPAPVAGPGFAAWCADALVPFVPIVAWFDAVDA